MSIWNCVFGFRVGFAFGGLGFDFGTVTFIGFFVRLSFGFEGWCNTETCTSRGDLGVGGLGLTLPLNYDCGFGYFGVFWSLVVTVGGVSFKMIILFCITWLFVEDCCDFVWSL